ncbi:MAG: type II toxin-antitoxin system VapC family toxin [Planctomycetota bacterium]
MKLLLDTCAILWLAAAPNRLTTAARHAIASNPNELYVSAISAFEIALKHRKKKLDLGMEPDVWWQRAVVHHGLIVLPVSDIVAIASTALPPLHADPCDRIIMATALALSAEIVTSDALIAQYTDVKISW